MRGHLPARGCRMQTKSLPESSLKAGRKLLCRGGDGMEAHLPNPTLPLLGRRAGRGVWAGAALPAVPGGGGSDPNIHGSK